MGLVNYLDKCKINKARNQALKVIVVLKQFLILQAAMEFNLPVW